MRIIWMRLPHKDPFLAQGHYLHAKYIVTMLRNASLQILVVLWLFSCTSSSDDKWYKSANNVYGKRGTLEQKADSMARAMCVCMSTILASEMGSSALESILIDLERFAELPAAERRAREGEMEQKAGPLWAAMESLSQSGDSSPPQCMHDLKARTTALERDPDGLRLFKTTQGLFASNCRIVRVMSLLVNESFF